MKTHDGSGGIAPPFLTSAVDGGEYVTESDQRGRLDSAILLVVLCNTEACMINMYFNALRIPAKLPKGT
jgi:hypothetical protein